MKLSRQISEKFLNFMKILLAEAEFHRNRLLETDMIKLIVAFRNFANVPKIIQQIVKCRDAMIGSKFNRHNFLYISVTKVCAKRCN